MALPGIGSLAASFGIDTGGGGLSLSSPSGIRGDVELGDFMSGGVHIDAADDTLKWIAIAAAAAGLFYVIGKYS